MWLALQFQLSGSLQHLFIAQRNNIFYVPKQDKKRERKREAEKMREKKSNRNRFYSQMSVRCICRAYDLFLVNKRRI